MDAKVKRLDDQPEQIQLIHTYVAYSYWLNERDESLWCYGGLNKNVIFCGQVSNNEYK